MKFYRLEKRNHVLEWTFTALKAFGLSLLFTVVLMLVCGYKFMIVTSGSMEPTLPVGSLVIVTPCDYDDLEYRDIVTFTGESGVNFTHRIVGKSNSKNHDDPILPGEEGFDEAYSWVTRGDYDGAKVDSGYVKSKEIVGKIYESHCFTFTGTIVRYVRSNFMMIIIFMFILVAVVELVNFLKRQLEEDDVECYETDDEE
ncbi:MAG: signal peptidase I [Clostridiales bacterium]|nr:signal peptidase I [Clostridiales bacterium]